MNNMSSADVTAHSQSKYLAKPLRAILNCRGHYWHNKILTLTDGPWLAGSSIKEERPELQESRCQRWNKTMLLGWNLKVFVRRLTRSLGHTGSHSQRAPDVMGTWNNMKSLDRNLKVEQHIGGSRKVDGVG